MKILYLHQYFATRDSNGGTRSYEMARRLISYGHRVTFITTSAFLPEHYNFKKGWNQLEIDGITLHVLHLPYSNHDSFISRIFKFIYFALKSTFKVLHLESDVLFATSTPLTIAIPSIIYSKIKKIPMVFEVRDLWPEIPIAMGIINNRFLILLLEFLESYTYKNSAQLVGLSEGMVNGIAKKGISKRNITLIPNSCDTDLFDVEDEIGKDYKRNFLEFVGDRKLIVYTGTFGKVNDVGYLVHLAKASWINSYNLCFIAIGSGIEKDKIVDLAYKEKVLNINLFILDPIPKKEIIKLLSAADLSISLVAQIPELWNNSANKIFDSFASGTPILINYGGWQKDLIKNTNCGLVLHDDYMKSAEKINNFLKNETMYLKAKESCFFLAYNHFSRNILAKELEKVLIKAVSITDCSS